LMGRRVPRSVKKDMAAAVGTMFTGWFSGGSSARQDSQSANSAGGAEPGLVDEGKQQPQRRGIEDVLCWLPPSPLLLTQATALLLRLTLLDAIPESDDRWADLRAAWTMTIRNDCGIGNSVEDQTAIEFMPLAMMASSLLIEPSELHSNDVSDHLRYAMQGLHKMGNIMKLGQPKTASSSSHDSDASLVDDWREVLQLLARAREPPGRRRWEMPLGMSSPTYRPFPSSSADASRPVGWDLDVRQFLEHALCRAALEAGNYEGLCLARSACSEGATLRPNCPELWWRYGAVLDAMGDGVAAENARAASVGLGGGEGGATF